MNFFNLRPSSGERWPILPDAQLSQVWAAYLALNQTQWLSRAEIEHHQLEQCRVLLHHCKKHVPYYREMLNANEIDIESIRTLDELRRIPTLSRQTWQMKFDQFCAAELPPGTVAVDEDRTSGTSGIPIRVLKTNVFYVWWLAFYLRDLEWSGLRPSGTIASIRATLSHGPALERLLTGERHSCWNPIIEPLLETGPLYGMDIRQKPERQIEWLSEVNPDYLLSHTSNLELLASLLCERPRKLYNLKAIQAISETLTEEAQIKIERAFGAPVKNLYSCAEAGYLASPCPKGEGMHVHAENVILEILDDLGNVCPPGVPGRVVITVLHNFRSPFIRYDIGDFATISSGNCACGRGLPLLNGVHGKSRPYFRLSGNRYKHSTDLVRVITAIGGHHQH